jgi:exodeoxyribonuclease V gamma subunit
MREMEVLRDQLLDAFASTEDLRPDDVLVLVPDIERYGPYIEAVFGAREKTTFMPYSVADRQGVQEQPPADAVLRLLDLVRARLTTAEVIDLLNTAAIRRRFDLGEKEIPLLHRWVEAARVRWGMDAAQRQEDFEIPAQEANSWRAGLDRLLMGYATGPLVGLAGGVAPQAGETAGNAELLGRLANFVDTLFDALRGLRRSRPLNEWATDLGLTLDRLFKPFGEGEERALQLVRDALNNLKAVEKRAGVQEPISLEVLRDHLRSYLAEIGPGGRFLSGRITFCALKPMRTIPFRVVAIAGLDIASFPRRGTPHSFDLMRQNTRLGDRSLRDDDRQLFLETLLAARDRLIFTWVGNSQQDGSSCAPSVVLSELLDVLERGFLSPDEKPLRDHLIVVHRLQPFHPSYFSDGPLFSYSHHDLEAASALLRDRKPTPQFIALRNEAQRLPTEREEEDVDLDDLLGFWVHPARHYCRKVLRIYLENNSDEPETSEPFQIGGLDQYLLLQWILHQRLHPDELLEDESTILRARGELPLAGLGSAAYAVLRSRVNAFFSRLPNFNRRPPQLLEIKGPGFRLHGRLDDLTDLGQLRFRLSSLKPKDQLRAWILHLAWNALPVDQQAPPSERHTLLIAEDQQLRFPPQAAAADLLGDLVNGYLAGCKSPLPFFENTSQRYANQRKKLADPRSRSSKDPLDAAREIWSGSGLALAGEGPTPEAEDPYNRLCFRGREPVEEAEFSRWAEKVWSPLFEVAEEMPP